MLMLLLHVGKEVYAVACDRVVEVVPLVVVKAIPYAPPHLAGVFNYRGRVVPVVDLCVVLAGRQCAPRLSSRIVVVTVSSGEEQKGAVGLLAERVTETATLAAGAFELLREELEVAPFLGGIATGAGGMIQELRVDQLLAHVVPRRLLAAQAGAEDDGAGADPGTGEAGGDDG